MLPRTQFILQPCLAYSVRVVHVRIELCNVTLAKKSREQACARINPTVVVSDVHNKNKLTKASLFPM
jgi:hypothetical protein